ncbi:virulence factor Mce family protein [Thermomonospora echinospora]|uniref:Virulence factor Mce family protein n=1 Tax=Thermomonospora echinospora TaxID=1992 RepID=A0A1H5VMN4_9ACTN|nr:MlaD family protein [Thermomonospora echinospora]SEF88453.1 virulence factor Mce family protein [Thermomonospora echinospora]
MRRLLVLATTAAMAVSLGGCSLLGGDGGRREMTVEFAKARSFYPGSKVKIMGTDVGSVDSVENLGDRIRVRFHLRSDIPLPAGVHASIVPLNLVGERNLVLHPPWKPGLPKETGDQIPMQRTSVPVEVDDALDSFTKLSNALDPTQVNKALGGAAESFKGNGQSFNATLEQAGRLVENIAGQDEELLEVARNLDRLAGVVRGREQVLGQMISDFGEATRVLAAERGELQDLVRGVLELTEQGDKLLKKYKGQLPYDLAVLTRFALSLQGQSKRVAQLLDALPEVSNALIGGYNPKAKALNLRFATDVFLRTWLTGLMGTDDVPCPLPEPNSNCPWQQGGN